MDPLSGFASFHSQGIISPKQTDLSRLVGFGIPTEPHLDPLGDTQTEFKARCIMRTVREDGR